MHHAVYINCKDFGQQTSTSAKAIPVITAPPVWITSTVTRVSVHLGTQAHSVKQVKDVLMHLKI